MLLDVAEEADSLCFNTLFNSLSMKKQSKIQRRFSDEQITTLETMFESDSKLEPRKKLQLAKQLGLQPKQVAIWFQNKRARWRSKQLEKEYSVLRASYDSLSSQFQILKTENQSLLLQLKKLHELMEKKRENCDEGGKPSLKLGGSEKGVSGVSEDSSRKSSEYLGVKEEQLNNNNNNSNVVDGSLTSTENWDDLVDSSHYPPLHLPLALLDEAEAEAEAEPEPALISDTSNQWWDFWS